MKSQSKDQGHQNDSLFDSSYLSHEDSLFVQDIASNFDKFNIMTNEERDRKNVVLDRFQRNIDILQNEVNKRTLQQQMPFNKFIDREKFMYQRGKNLQNEMFLDELLTKSKLPKLKVNNKRQIETRVIRDVYKPDVMKQSLQQLYPHSLRRRNDRNHHYNTSRLGAESRYLSQINEQSERPSQLETIKHQDDEFANEQNTTIDSSKLRSKEMNLFSGLSGAVYPLSNITSPKNQMSQIQSPNMEYGSLNGIRHYQKQLQKQSFSKLSDLPLTLNGKTQSIAKRKQSSDSQQIKPFRNQPDITLRKFNAPKQFSNQITQICSNFRNNKHKLLLSWDFKNSSISKQWHKERTKLDIMFEEFSERNYSLVDKKQKLAQMEAEFFQRQNEQLNRGIQRPIEIIRTGQEYNLK